jgi:hypothetical protein
MGRAGEWAGGEPNPPASSTEVHSCPLGPLRPLSREGDYLRQSVPASVEGILTT